jgi:hypothetical protein
MIDIEELERLAKAATSGLPGDRIPFALHAMDPEGILALIAEVRALREDARRYQWLKAHWGHRTPILNGLFPRGVVDDAFDAGIDMAIAREKA